MKPRGCSGYRRERPAEIPQRRSRSLGPVALALLVAVAHLGCGPGRKRPEPVVHLPLEVPLVPSSTGKVASKDNGLKIQGSWQGAAGPDSQITLDFANGAVCLRGQTALVPSNQFSTYWGAEARFSLCEAGDGTLQTLDQCLSAEALAELAGFAFTLETAALPARVSVRFEEANRELPASIRLTAPGEQYALFDQAATPFDPNAPPVDPSALVAVTLRVSGRTDAVQPFDLCLSNFRALLGPDWKLALIPDWLEEPGAGKKLEHVGVNLVGAEFGEQNLPGVVGTDYVYPTASDLALYAERGMDVIRLPFRWERLQRQYYADLDPTELGYLTDTVAAAEDLGMTVIVDPHNFARYDEDSTDALEPSIIGVDVEPEVFADFWGKLAAAFANDDRVWFGLVNEPHTMPTETWLGDANLAIAAIRTVGANNFILVPGNGWTGAHSWFSNYYGTPNSNVMPGIVDSLNNFGFELHQYMDSDSSGTSNTCVSETVGVERVQAVTSWLREQGVRGFLGEFGASDDPVCLRAVDNLLAHLDANPDVWRGWTAWAATAWNIQFNLRPRASGDDVLEMMVLRRHTDG
jgi:endoglucanase